MKTGIQPDESIAVWVAKVLKRPVKWRAERSEEFASTTAGRDQLHKMSTGARQGRPDHRAAHARLRQCRRLSVGRRHRHPAVRRAQGLDRHLRHAGDRFLDHLRADQHRHDRRLSRRRPARMPPRSRAPGRHRRAPDRHGSGRTAPPQLREAVADALHLGDGREVRFRRLRPLPHQDARGMPTGTASPPARPRPRSAASSTAAGSPPTSNGPAPWC